MKNIKSTLVLVSVPAMMLSCGTPRVLSDSDGKMGIKDSLSVSDSTEYDLVVFDSGFDYWLNSRGYSKTQYSDEYLRSKNLQYVNEWNRRFYRGDRRISSYIDYDLYTKYGLDFNYKLFMYFKFFEDTNGIKLIPGGGR